MVLGVLHRTFGTLLTLPFSHSLMLSLSLSLRRSLFLTSSLTPYWCGRTVFFCVLLFACL